MIFNFDSTEVNNIKTAVDNSSRTIEGFIRKSVPQGSPLADELTKYSGIYSSIFPNIYFLSENGTSIEFYCEQSNGIRTIDVNSYDEQGKEYIFFQFLAAIKIIYELDLNFIKISDFSIDNDLSVRFSLSDDKVSYQANLNTVRDLFPDLVLYPLSDPVIIDMELKRLASESDLNPERIFCYRLNEFTLSILHGGMKKILNDPGRLSVLISTKSRSVKKFIKYSIINNLIGENVMGFLVDSYMPDLVENMVSILPGDKRHEDISLDRISEGVNKVLSGTEYRSVVFAIDRRLENIESDILSQLQMDEAICNRIKILSINEDCGINFDVKINEDSSNLIDYNIRKVKNYSVLSSEKNIDLVKRLSVIPLSYEIALKIFLSERAMLDELLKREVLYKKDSILHVNKDRVKDFIPDQSEEIIILKSFTGNKLQYPLVNFTLALKENRFSDAVIILGNYFKKEPEEFQENAGIIIEIIKKNIKFLKKQQDLIIFSIVTLLKAGKAECMDQLNENIPGKSLKEYFPSLEVLSRVIKIEPQNISSSKDSSRIEKRAFNEIDHYYFVRAIHKLINNDIRSYSMSIRNINDKFFRNLALLIRFSCSDLFQFATKTEINKAVVSLSNDLYIRSGYILYCFREILRSRNDLMNAKHFESLERLRKLYFKCRNRNLGFLSGKVSFELGDNYFRTGRFSASGFWFERAKKDFSFTMDKYNILRSEFCISRIEMISGNIKNFINKLNRKKNFELKNGILTGVANSYFELTKFLIIQNRTDKAMRALNNGLKISINTGLNDTNIISEYYMIILRLLLIISNSTDLNQNNSFKPPHPHLSYRSPLNDIISNILEKGVIKDSHIDDLSSLIPAFEEKFILLSLLFKVTREKKILESLQAMSEEVTDIDQNIFSCEYTYLYYDIPENFSEGAYIEKRNDFENMYHFFRIFGKYFSANVKNLERNYRENMSKVEVVEAAGNFERFKRWETLEDCHMDLRYGLNRIIENAGLYFRIVENTKIVFDKNSSPVNNKTVELLINSIHDFTTDCFITSDSFKNLTENPVEIFDMTYNVFFFNLRINREVTGNIFIFFDKKTSLTSAENFQLGKYLKDFSNLFSLFYENVFYPGTKLRAIIGNSRSVRRLKREISRVSKVDFSVLITGESGTGKELVARSLHQLGKRVNNTFIAINAATIPDNLLESELFGYVKGAFTDARSDRTGLIESADGGTVFFDEIGELPLNLQSKLLRVIQEMEIKRVGDTGYRKIDVRFIFATNRDLEKMTAEEMFRSDLFYRIQDIVINVPPLRDRTDDIPLLTKHFFNKYNFKHLDMYERDKICRDFILHEWKGNIRELESAVKRIITFYPDHIYSFMSDGSNPESKGLIPLRNEFEKNMVLRSLREMNWNRTKAAEDLSISRTYLFKLMKKYQIKGKSVDS